MSTAAWEPKKLIFFIVNNAHLSVSVLMFCEPFLAYSYCAHWWVCLLVQSMNIHIGLNNYIC